MQSNSFKISTIIYADSEKEAFELWQLNNPEHMEISDVEIEDVSEV